MLMPRFPSLWRTDPWTGFRDLQREINRLFEGFPFRVGEEFPRVNVWANDTEAILTAELPGVEADDMDISVEGDILTIRGTRKPESLDERSTYHRRERETGDFVRSVQLPFAPERDKVTAEFKNGVLRIRAPRSEQEKPRRITVRSA